MQHSVQYFGVMVIFLMDNTLDKFYIEKEVHAAGPEEVGHN